MNSPYSPDRSKFFDTLKVPYGFHPGLKKRSYRKADSLHPIVDSSIEEEAS
jgi:hypothetical protein